MTLDVHITCDHCGLRVAQPPYDRRWSKLQISYNTYNEESKKDILLTVNGDLCPDCLAIACDFVNQATPEIKVRP